MIESKLKTKNRNRGQLFRSGWVSSAEYCIAAKRKVTDWLTDSLLFKH